MFALVRKFLVVSSLALLSSGCLFAPGDSEESGTAVLSDEGWIPVLPQLPAGWPAIQWPEDNPFTPEKAILGRRLFFETALSSKRTIACDWCHDPLRAFADRHTGMLSHGVDGLSTERNTPTLANLIFATSFLMDGGASSLEEQVLLPLLSPNEMNMTADSIESRLAADTLYVRLFRQAYGEGPITIDGVARALATYQRTLVSYRTPFDAWLAGDEEALSPSARRGAALFLGEKTGCTQCHTPPLLTDGLFHNTGLDSVYADPGRAGVTGLAADVGKFKTPTLRNLALTEPYMHDGRFWTLNEVIRHYNSGGQPHPNASPSMRPLGLDDYEILDLENFLRELIDYDLAAESRP